MTDRSNGKVIKLERRFYLLWAIPSGGKEAFEVSRAVNVDLQPECPSSPLCPEEVGISPDEARKVRPQAPGGKDYVSKNCPYHYATKQECYKARNIQALREGLWKEKEVGLIGNFLEALGYKVEEEEIPESKIDGSRILMAHGHIYNFHDVRFITGPGNVEIILVRNPYQ
jgi:hypothetical protein